MTSLEQRLHGLARLAAYTAELPSARIIMRTGATIASVGEPFDAPVVRVALAGPGEALLVGGAAAVIDGERHEALVEIGRQVDHLLAQRDASAELRAANNTFQSSMDASPFGIFHVNAEGHVLRVNRAWRALFGLGWGELPRGSTWLEHVHADDRERIRSVYDIAMTGVQMPDEALRMSFGENDLACVLRLLRMTHDGEFAGLIGLIIDRSAEVELSDELRRTDEQYRAALECAEHGVWVLRTGGGGRFFYSDSWKAVLGYEPHELGDDFETWNGIVHPEDLPAAGAAFEQHLAGLAPRYQAECRMRCKDGGYRWIQSRGRIMHVDERGMVMVGTNTDVTERRLMEERLRDSERRLLEAEQIASVGHWEWREDLANLIWTPETYRIVGWDPAKPAMPASIVSDRIFDENEQQPIIATMREVLRDGIERVIEYPVTQPSGNVVHCRTHVRRETHDGRVALCGTMQDITREVLVRETLQRAKEEAEALARMRSEFLATMSHEIRTPLNGVLGLSALLASTQLDAEQREYVAGARAAGQSLLALINDLLDFSKIEAGALVLEPHPFSPIELAEDTVSMLAEAAHGKGLDLWLDVDASIPVELVGDVARLRQILINLVGNAVKFTDAGEVEVRVGASRIDRHTAQLEVRVRDTGIGISAEAAAHLFDAFVQADDPARRHRGGTGLGLAISRRLAREMQGDITVLSTQGRGSEFTFTAPLPIEHDAPAREMLPPGVTVLLVDQRRGTEALARMLEGAGARVVRGDPWSFPSPAVARGMSIDVVLVDSELAKSTERATLLALFEAIGSTRPAECIALVDMASRARAADPDFAEVVTRPVRRNAVLDAIGRSLRHDLPPQHVSWKRGGLALRVLVAEDNPVNQFLVTQVLKKLDCSVMVVGDGRDAIEAVRTGAFDIVLMDCFMPNMDGFEATRAIRATTPGRVIPIIALTAGAIEADRKRCFEAGMDDYLSKPFEMAQLVRVLERWRIH